jgi:NDP-sugar pyrophosphorylase family protein
VVIRADSYVVGPVVIGRNCYIGPNSVILPSTAIGDKCSIGSFTELKYSVIMDDVRIGTGSVVSNSVSGSHNILGPHFATEIKKGTSDRNKGIVASGRSTRNHYW